MHLKGPQWNRRVDEMLEIVGLSQYRRIYPHELCLLYTSWPPI